MLDLYMVATGGEGGDPIMTTMMGFAELSTGGGSSKKKTVSMPVSNGNKDLFEMLSMIMSAGVFDDE